MSWIFDENQSRKLSTFSPPSICSGKLNFSGKKNNNNAEALENLLYVNKILFASHVAHEGILEVMKLMICNQDWVSGWILEPKEFETSVAAYEDEVRHLSNGKLKFLSCKTSICYYNFVFVELNYNLKCFAEIKLLWSRNWK